MEGQVFWKEQCPIEFLKKEKKNTQVTGIIVIIKTSFLLLSNNTLSRAIFKLHKVFPLPVGILRILIFVFSLEFSYACS